MNKILLTLMFTVLSFSVLQDASAMEEDKPLVSGKITKKKRHDKRAKIAEKEERTIKAIEEWLKYRDARRAAEERLNPHIPNPNAFPYKKISFKR